LRLEQPDSQKALLFRANIQGYQGHILGLVHRGSREQHALQNNTLEREE